MADYGQKVADRALKTVDRRIRMAYKQTEKELQKKLADFTEKFEKKNKELLADLADELISEEEYKNWLTLQVFNKGIWEQKLKECQEILLKHNEQAVNVVRENQIGVFAQNYNYFAKRTTGVTGVSFSMYDRHAVARLLKNKPQLLPQWKINEDKEYKWSRQRVQTAIRQGIIQGESIDQITSRLTTALATQAENRMRLFARTAVTEAQNAGRMEMLHDAEEMGIRVKKKWLATLDNRTRDSHADIDGEVVDVDEEFSNGLMYPGDPSGDPAEVYNCRCTLVYVYPDFE